MKNTYQIGPKIICTNNPKNFSLLARNSISCSIDEIKTGQDLCTIGASTCIAGGGLSYNNGAIFHFNSPSNTDLNALYSDMRDIQSPNIIITGGLHPWDRSKIVFDDIMEKLREFRDRMTIIWGQKDSEGTSLHCSVEKNTYTLWHQGSLPLNSAEDLKKIYEIVEVSPNAKLIFNPE